MLDAAPDAAPGLAGGHGSLWWFHGAGTAQLCWQQSRFPLLTSSGAVNILEPRANH